MKADGRLLIVAGLLCLLGAGQWHAPLIDMRQEFQLQRIPPEDTTPLVSLTTVAFGGFRGLVADVLWIRAGKLQEEGQFFELVQLSKWISQLEPRVPEVWSYQSWNLAYNISVLFPDHGDRWRWVNHGIELLRKQGLTHNPASDSLHWDLGWMFQHKIGMRFDEAHPRYKAELAAQVNDILPGGRLPDSPGPETVAGLRETFSMETGVMVELDRLYGPIDWRIPEAHSLYWSFKGMPLAGNVFQQRSLQRMRFGSLRALMLRGTLLGNPADGGTIAIPLPDLLPKLVKEARLLYASEPESPMVRTVASVLEDSVVLLSEYGRLDEAESVYEDLQTLPQFRQTPLPPFSQWLQQHFTRPVEQMSTDLMMVRVVALLRTADQLEAENPAQASDLRQKVRRMHWDFQTSRQDEEHLARTGLPDWDLITRLVSQAPPLGKKF